MRLWFSNFSWVVFDNQIGQRSHLPPYVELQTYFNENSVTCCFNGTTNYTHNTQKVLAYFFQALKNQVRETFPERYSVRNRQRLLVDLKCVAYMLLLNFLQFLYTFLKLSHNQITFIFMFRPRELKRKTLYMRGGVCCWIRS